MILKVQGIHYLFFPTREHNMQTLKINKMHSFELIHTNI